MNPLWGLKQEYADIPRSACAVPKSMNPLWGLKLTATAVEDATKKFLKA